MAELYVHIASGEPGPLPVQLSALNLTPAELVDLAPFGYPGSGYLRLEDRSPEAWDDVVQAADPLPIEMDLEHLVAVRRWRIVTRPDAAERLAARRAAAIAEVKSGAGFAIAAWVPPGWDLAYAEKHRQALIVLAGGEAGQALAREAARRGCTVTQLAAMIAAKAAAWDAALGDIEDRRLAAEAAIAAATSGTEIDQIIRDIRWPSP